MSKEYTDCDILAEAIPIASEKQIKWEKMVQTEDQRLYAR